jgi:hypothetical protein
LEKSDGTEVLLPGDSELKCIAIHTGKHVVVLSPSEVVLSPSEIPCCVYSPEDHLDGEWFATSEMVSTIKGLQNPIVLVCEDNHFSGTGR